MSDAILCCDLKQGYYFLLTLPRLKAHTHDDYKDNNKDTVLKIGLSLLKH